MPSPPLTFLEYHSNTSEIEIEDTGVGCREIPCPILKKNKFNNNIIFIMTIYVQPQEGETLVQKRDCFEQGGKYRVDSVIGYLVNVETHLDTHTMTFHLRSMEGKHFMIDCFSLTQQGRTLILSVASQTSLSSKLLSFTITPQAVTVSVCHCIGDQTSEIPLACASYPYDRDPCLLAPMISSVLSSDVMHACVLSHNVPDAFNDMTPGK